MQHVHSGEENEFIDTSHFKIRQIIYGHKRATLHFFYDFTPTGPTTNKNVCSLKNLIKFNKQNVE